MQHHTHHWAITDRHPRAVVLHKKAIFFLLISLPLIVVSMYAHLPDEGEFLEKLHTVLSSVIKKDICF